MWPLAGPAGAALVRRSCFVGTAMKDALLAYVKRVKSLYEKVKGIGNEQATKSSLIGPLFALLGYDLADPEECVPEFKADFGKERSVKPVDWAFYQNGRPIFLVEAKDAAKKIGGYDEQLGDYFAKVPDVKLGILTNGVQAPVARSCVAAVREAGWLRRPASEDQYSVSQVAAQARD